MHLHRKPVPPKALVPLVSLLLLVLLTAFIPATSIPGFWSLANIIKLILVVVFSYSLVFWSYSAAQHYHVFRRSVEVVAIFGALASLLVIAISPSTANMLVQEDHNLENIQAVFLFLGSALFLTATIRFAVKKDSKRAVIAGIFFVIMFLIGMEEISWMQRILHTNSDSFFQEYNQQGETNFHNLDTSLSEGVYYFGSFLFLVLIPFFYYQWVGFLKRFRHGTWNILTEFLPPAWFAVPFALMTGFVSPYSYQQTTILIGFVCSVLILIYELRRSVVARNRVAIFVRASCVALLIFIGFWCTFHDSALESLRAGAPKEYMENMISFGLFAYAARFYIKKFLLPKKHASEYLAKSI